MRQRHPSLASPQVNPSAPPRPLTIPAAALHLLSALADVVEAVKAEGDALPREHIDALSIWAFGRLTPADSREGEPE
jgi:hypothetical protein